MYVYGVCMCMCMCVYHFILEDLTLICKLKDPIKQEYIV